MPLKSPLARAPLRGARHQDRAPRSGARRQDRRARSCALFAPLISLWLAPACLVDLDDRCGENQHYDAEQVSCLCDAEYALQSGECVACPEHEVGSPGGCVCEPGFTRPEPEAACQMAAG